MINNPSLKKKDSSHGHGQHNKQSTDAASSTHSKSSGTSLFSGWMSTDGSSNAITSAASDFLGSNKYGVIRINDLTVTFDPASFTLNDSAVEKSSTKDGITSNMYTHHNSSAVLDMQIACLVYTAIVHKRIADHLALLLRYHFTRAMTATGTIVHSHTHTNPQQQASSGNTSATSSTTSSSSAMNLSSSHTLLSVLQHQWVRVSDVDMLEYFKEANDVREKREALLSTLDKLHKASKVFESI